MDTRSECNKLEVLAPSVEIPARFDRALPTIFPLGVLPQGNYARNDQNRVRKEKRIVLHSPGSLMRDRKIHIHRNHCDQHGEYQDGAVQGSNVGTLIGQDQAVLG